MNLITVIEKACSIYFNNFSSFNNNYLTIFIFKARKMQLSFSIFHLFLKWMKKSMKNIGHIEQNLINIKLELEI